MTVNLRAVDIRSGRILNSVTTSKTILSQQVQAGVFRFVEYKRLLEAEAGFSTNEPVQMCVMSAIESAVIRLIANGVRDNLWQLADARDMETPYCRVICKTAPPSSLVEAASLVSIYRLPLSASSTGPSWACFHGLSPPSLGATPAKEAWLSLTSAFLPDKTLDPESASNQLCA